MTWSILYLLLSVFGLLCTLNAIRPLRVELLSLSTFVAGWLTSELPIHTLVWQAILSGVFVANGALDGWAGRVGLVLTLVSWSGLALLVVRAQQTEPVCEEALREVLGAGYRSRMAERLSRDQSPSKAWRRLVLPFRMTDPDVEKIKNLSYVDDGTRAHRLDVYRNRTPTGAAPVFIYVHGGGWVLGDKREQGIPLMLHLAAHGWVCFTVNYRLSPKATWPDHIVDVKRAIAWVKDHAREFGGDPSLVAISGGSAGGHLAALAALTASDTSLQPGFEAADTSVDACVPIYGVYDFTNRDGLRGDSFISLFLQRRIMKRPFATDRRLYEMASPMDRIGPDTPPFFVVHGSNDSLVPVREARRFVELLKAGSREPVVYAELPGAQHAFEVFRSIRTAHAVDAIGRFLAVVASEVETRRAARS